MPRRSTTRRSEPGRPTVHVLLSTYDGERFLAEQLASILEQDGVDLRMTVRDDGSRDSTRALLGPLVSDPRVAIHSGPNLGAARSFLELLRLAGDGAPFYALADQDDVWDRDKLAAAVRMLAPLPQDEPALYCSTLDFLDARGRRRGRTRPPRILGFENALVENVAIGCTVVINAAARRLLLQCDPPELLMHDAWAYLAVSAFGRIVFDPQPHIAYRQHGGNAFGADPRRLVHFFIHLRRLIRRRRLGFHAQAVAFRHCFGARLDAERAAILEGFIASRRGLGSRIRYALRKRVVRQTMIDDLLLRILIVLGAT